MNSEDFNKLNNIPNPYDPSTNNNMNIENLNSAPSEPAQEEKAVSNPYSIENNNPFNQNMTAQYNENIDQSNNYNIDYNSQTRKGKAEKNKMGMKYVIFIAVILLVALIIFIVSKFA